MRLLVYSFSQSTCSVIESLLQVLIFCYCTIYSLYGRGEGGSGGEGGDKRGWQGRKARKVVDNHLVTMFIWLQFFLTAHENNMLHSNNMMWSVHGCSYVTMMQRIHCFVYLCTNWSNSNNVMWSVHGLLMWQWCNEFTALYICVQTEVICLVTAATFINCWVNFSLHIALFLSENLLLCPWDGLAFRGGDAWFCQQNESEFLYPCGLCLFRISLISHFLVVCTVVFASWISVKLSFGDEWELVGN